MAVDKRWDEGFEAGISDQIADWRIAMTEVLGLDDDCEISPMRMADALAAILTDEQKRRLETLLREEGK